MKQKLQLWCGAAAALLLCILFAWVFVTYSQPMEDRMFDLSVYVNDSEITGTDTSQELGWTVFTQTGDEVTLLTSDGHGCYAGLEYAGQTFYFSRVMTEELAAATLQLGTADRNFAVFLDGEMIYTDCPEQGSRIGSLTLPMHGQDRTSNVTISLPDGYLGKTLTIAQSTSPYPETPRMATIAFPCSVKLYCGFAYESELIAESFQTAALGAVGYVLGAALLVLFTIGLIRRRADAGLLLLALTVFLTMSAQMYSTSYALNYFGIPDLASTAVMLRQVTTVMLLAFLSSRAGRFRCPAWILTGLCTAALAAFVLLGRDVATRQDLISFLVWSLPGILQAVGLLAMLICSWLLRRESRFHRVFAPLVSTGVVAYLLVQLLLPTRGEFFATLFNSVRNVALLDISSHLSWLMTAAALLIVTVQFVRDELERYAEKKLAILQGDMTRQSYENLRLHNEEVMILRHDMNRHFQYLRSITTDERAAEYLDALIGQSERVRPILQCGHEMLDVILGSRAAIAASSGIELNITRAAAPDALPLADADLCSLMMNLLDNALEAARTSGAEKPCIRLDLHMKNDFFVFICENSTAPAPPDPAQKETVPKHGLGLKIVSQIVDKYGLLMHTEQTDGLYRVHLAIQLHQPSR